ncbi:hypothetical protein ILYODFUR_034541 [Ilyodon furcidens]|uniref:Uncharacterized protein n=1 Tax=Ilyodon furcidens TaxID=33524 RepID=A0ABV0V8I3_9TELE
MYGNSGPERNSNMGRLGGSATETERRCTPEGSDGCGAGTGSAVRMKPVVEVGIQRSTGSLEWQRENTLHDSDL